MTDNKDHSLSDALKALKRSQRDRSPADDAPATTTHTPRAPEDTAPQAIFQGMAQSSKILSQLVSALDTFWNGWLGGITKWLSPFTSRLVKFYQWSYRKFAQTGPKDARIFSHHRAIGVTLTLIAVTLFTPWFVVTQAVPFSARTLYDASMLATMKEDQLFLSKPDIIDADRDVFQVTGCRDINGCDGGDNTIYYRLRPNVIMSINYWTTRFEPYDPAEISSAMVSELNNCTIRYYGRRVKALGWYPYIVSASCTPVLGRG